MIERHDGTASFVCDECGEWFPQTFDEADFQQMVNAAITAGWRIRHKGIEGWVHQCANCKPSGLAAQRRLLGLPPEGEP